MTIVLAAVAALNLAACGGIETGTLLGLDGGVFDALFEVDLDTGEATVLHFLDVESTGLGLAVGPDGTLYAAYAGDGEGLATIDPETGALAFVGPFGYEAVSALAFAPNGRLYGFDGFESLLLEVNVATGEGTLIGPLGGIGGGGLAFTSDGTLYFTGNPSGGPRLYTVNLVTGEATEIGPLGSDLDSAHGLATVGDVLYAYAHWCAGPPFDLLVTLDRNTGEATQVGGLCPGKGCPNMHGLTFLPGPGDGDRDGDVDLDDFAFFQSCFTGPLGTESPSPPGCRFMDADGDNDADIHDFAIFQAAFTGPNDPDD